MLVTGTGVGEHLANVSVGFAATNAQCYRMVHDQYPTANGATMTGGTDTYCAAENGVCTCNGVVRYGTSVEGTRPI
jgi:hypothetical protein